MTDIKFVQKYLEQLASRTGLRVEQAKRFLQSQAELAYEAGESGYPLPGLGVIKVVSAPPKVIEGRFGQAKGEKKVIPATKKLKFNFTDAAKGPLLGLSPASDVFTVDWFPEEEKDI